MSNVVSFPNHVCCLRIYSTIISVSPESMYNLLPRSTKKITPKENIGTDKRTAASKGRQTRWLKTAIFIAVFFVLVAYPYILSMTNGLLFKGFSLS